MEKPIVTTIGILIIAAIYWFFFGKKEEATEVGDQATVVVDGGYKPSVIRIPQGKPVKLTFLRKDQSACLEDIYFPDYKIKTYLPINTPVTVTLPPSRVGTSSFHCGMDMYHGRIEVVHST